MGPFCTGSPAPVAARVHTTPQIGGPRTALTSEGRINIGTVNNSLTNNLPFFNPDPATAGAGKGVALPGGLYQDPTAIRRSNNNFFGEFPRNYVPEAGFSGVSSGQVSQAQVSQTTDDRRGGSLEEDVSTSGGMLRNLRLCMHVFNIPPLSVCNKALVPTYNSHLNRAGGK
eukprot:649975-Prorocentrum_minimum.AAC.4